MTLRKGAQFGAHRVVEPNHALPQAAQRLSSDLPIFDNEALIEVEVLNIDSASFRQMASLDASEAAIAKLVLANVKAKGKQINPVTGSGGMLIGRVAERGPAFAPPAPEMRLGVGDRIATLVSLTLTPLHLRAVDKVFLDGPREAQMVVQGHAILFSGAPFAVLPSDLPESLALSILDVCGAPAQVERLVKPGMRVLVLGAGGKSGLLCLHQARKKLGNHPQSQLIALDYSEKGLSAVRQTRLADVILQGDATAPLEIFSKIEKATAGALADIVFNTANVAHTEMACILSSRQGGSVYFFNMATDFSRAALGSEGVGRDVTLYIGNGFTPGHAELALNIVRENKILFNILNPLA